MAAGVAPGAGGKRADRRRRPARAIVHPRLDEGAHGLDAVVRDQGLESALADPAGAYLRAVVAVPDVGRADLLQPDAHDVRLVLAPLLNPHAGEVHALLIERCGIGQVGGGLRRADIGVMRAREHPEERLAVGEDRHAEGHVGVVRDPVIGAVVEEGVALLHVVEELGDRPGRELQRADVDRHRLLDADQPVVVGEDAAGHIARVGDDGRARCAHHRVAHLADDRFQPAREHRHQQRVEAFGRFCHAGALKRRRCRYGSCCPASVRARWPASSRMVVVSLSIRAGPATSAPAGGTLPS